MNKFDPFLLSTHTEVDSNMAMKAQSMKQSRAGANFTNSLKLKASCGLKVGLQFMTLGLAKNGFHKEAYIK